MLEKHKTFREIAEKFERILALATGYAPIPKELRTRPKALPSARRAKSYDDLNAHKKVKRKDMNHLNGADKKLHK